MSSAGEQSGLPRLKTGIPNLDAILHGGLPVGVVTVLAGPPGTGKSILTQQMCFYHAAQGGRVLYFNTISQPTAKTLLYLRPFAFFDARLLEERIHFADLGLMLRTKGLELTCDLLMEQVKKFKPTMVVIDSFKVFDDLAQSFEELRKFTYELIIRLMAWECTTFLLGEHHPEQFDHPTYSAIDGIITLRQEELSGEQQRLMQIVKMRGTSHSRDAHPFIITQAGVEVYAPRVSLRRDPSAPRALEPAGRMKTGISKLDALLGEGIPHGSSIIVSGVAGSGKTVLGLEFLYRGARDHGEKGIFFSFEETAERLYATARGLGWELDREIERGLVKIVFIPQPDILVDRHLLEMQQHMEVFEARRVVVDSMSVFLHKIEDPRIVRDKVFWLANIVQNQGAVGFFSNDTPAGSRQLTRFGVEETVMDGVVSLTMEVEGLERQRYLEVVKLRSTAHTTGRHAMRIGAGGVSIFPRIDPAPPSQEPLGPAASGQRVSSGVPRLDELLGGGLFEGSVTLVSGSPGTGKSTLALQFALEAVRRQERALYITLGESPGQLLRNAGALGLPVREALKAKRLELLCLSREHVYAASFLGEVAERIHGAQLTRVVVDSASEQETQRPGSQEPRQLLFGLLGALRTLGVTSLCTFESRSLFVSDTLSERSLSPLADNLLMFRYVQDEGLLVPMLWVVKTRGSLHDGGRHRITVGEGGLRLSSGSEAAPPPSGEGAKKKPRPRLKRPRRK